MENIDNMAKNSLGAFSREALTKTEENKIKSDIIRGLISLSCLVTGLVCGAVFPDRDIVPALLYTVGFLIQAIPIIVTALKGIFSRELKNSMEILVSTAIIACYCTENLVLSILIPLILNIAHFLEERSIVGGREVIDGLKKMNENNAVLLENGEEKTVSAKLLKKGQNIIIRPGAAIPVDGTVVKGKTNVDQKSLTGEPQPAEKKLDDPVYAGTVNIDGQIIVRVEKEYVDTSFSKILSFLEEAENISTPETRLIDRFMKYYIPFVLIASAAVALFSSDITKAIAILVVACPCGQMLVSSAPMIAALSVAIKRGILVKNSKFLEELTEIDAVVFDKTGTITKGDLSLTGVVAASGVSDEYILRTALRIANSSNHPIAKALKKFAGKTEVDEEFEITETSGLGMRGVSADGKTKIAFGNRALLEKNGVSVPKDFEVPLSGSVSYVGVNGTFLGAMSFNDTKREEAAPCIKEFRDLGAERIVVLTGDRENSAKEVCEGLDIDEIKAQLLPMDKLEAIKDIKAENVVLAVGDGINDALALKEADIGVAMGAMGSDIAIQSADIALMNNNLENIPFAVTLANGTKKIIYQNLTLTCLISFVLIILSAFGYISILAGSILHNVGAFIVLLNSSRILNMKLP